MSDDVPPNVPPPYPGQQPSPGPQPNWGSAYPPPGQQPPPGYYPPAGYPPYAMPLPKHPRATTAMVLGIVGLAGGLLCYLPLFAAPFAWFYGSKAVRDIDEQPGALGGRGEANAGKILGIIGTVFLVLALAVVVLLIVLTFTVDDFWDTDDDYSYDALRGAFALLGGRS